MKLKHNNYAFIDAQNVHLGIKSLGWDLDWVKFRVYLKDKYAVNTAYLFIGFIQSNQDLYSSLQKAGYILIFKPIILDKEGKAKGNCDADLVLYTILEKIITIKQLSLPVMVILFLLLDIYTKIRSWQWF